MLVADVVVVGGGPAGAAAAITLARAGRDVVVIDRARFPRDKTCGDGLTAGALRLLEGLGLEPASVPSWQRVDDVVVRSPSGYTARFPLPRGRGSFAVVARRIDLDAALLDVARAAGAKVLDGHACTAATMRDDRVTLDVSGAGPIQARYAIGADGMWSPLRKALGAGEAGYLGEWHAFRQYLRDVSPTARDLFVWFEPDLLPGYAWSFPLPDGRANVGFGIQRGRDRAGPRAGAGGGARGRAEPGRVLRVQGQKALWPELLARAHIRDVLGPDAAPESAHRAWPIPARIDAVALSTGRALFVGDAAAATDPMTGEGIAQALLTGILAAEAVDGAGPHDAAGAARAYSTAVRHHLVADHRTSVLLSRALRHRKGARTAVRVAGSTAWTQRNFARWLFEDYPRGILATPSRWHQGVFSGDGAYRSGRSAVTARRP